MKQFQTFKMAGYNQQWPTSTAIAMHSSNPEPFDWQELENLTQLDLCRTLSQTLLSYESTQGNSLLRAQLTQIHYPTTSAKNLVLTSGAQEGIFLVINSLIKAGDEVLTFTPCFEPLVTVAQEAGAKVNTIALNPNDNWSIPWDEFEANINKNTQLVIINFPHNPTGSSINKTDFKRLISNCEKYGAWLFSDEVFRGLEHDNQAKLPAAVEKYDKGISMGVMSKSMALPGIRLGWLATRNMELLQRWLQIKSHLSICQSSLDVNLTNALLPFTEKIWQRNIDIITTNKSYLKKLLHDNAHFKFTPPKGSATAFIELVNQKADVFCLQLLTETNLFIMPNSVFLTPVDGFRLTLGKVQAEHFYEKFSQSE